MSASGDRFKKKPVKLFHVLRAAQAMIPAYEVKLHRKGWIPASKAVHKFTAAFGSNHAIA